MSSNDSAIKWLLGCGVVFLLVIVLCAGLGYWLFQKGVQLAEQVGEAIEEGFEEQTQRLQFAAEWKPPAEDAASEDLFPQSVLDFTLTADDRQAAVDEFDIDLAGHRADYDSGSAGVEVFAYRATSLEKEAIFTRVGEALDGGGFSSKWHVNFDLGHHARFDYSVSPPSQSGVLWWAGDWLFLFRATDTEMPLEPFIQAYLSAIQPAEAEQVESDPPADGSTPESVTRPEQEEGSSP